MSGDAGGTSTYRDCKNLAEFSFTRITCIATYRARRRLSCLGISSLLIRIPRSLSYLTAVLNSSPQGTLWSRTQRELIRFAPMPEMSVYEAQHLSQQADVRVPMGGVNNNVGISA